MVCPSGVVIIDSITQTRRLRLFWNTVAQLFKFIQLVSGGASILTRSLWFKDHSTILPLPEEERMMLTIIFVNSVYWEFVTC